MKDKYYIERLKNIIEYITEFEKIELDDYTKIVNLVNEWKDEKEEYFNKMGVDIFYLEKQIHKIKSMYSYISDDSFSSNELIDFMNDDEDNIVKDTYNWQEKHNNALDKKYNRLFDLYSSEKYIEAFKELKIIEEHDKDNEDE